MIDTKHRFYVEQYFNGWSVWDRSTSKNNGFIYPTKADADAVAAGSDAAGQFTEQDQQE